MENQPTGPNLTSKVASLPEKFEVFSSGKPSESRERSSTDSVGCDETEDREIDCPVCYRRVEDYFTTECNHSFCEPCLFLVRDGHKKIHGTESFLCPLCREPIPISLTNVKMYLPPFVSTNYPLNPDFSCIGSDHIRTMIQSAYECIHNHEKWLLLYQYVADDARDVICYNSSEIDDLTDKIKDHYPGNHSDNTIDVTMRMIHYIAIYGYYRFSVTVDTDKKK